MNIDPKVWKPVALAVLAIVVQVIATGEFDRAELSQTILTAGYAVIGYLTSNDGTVLRTVQEDGNAYPPEAA